MGKYLFLQWSVTMVDVSGKTKTIKKTKKGTNVVNKTKITFIAAMRAIYVMFCTKVSFFSGFFIKRILTILKFFAKKIALVVYVYIREVFYEEVFSHCPCVNCFDWLQ